MPNALFRWRIVSNQAFKEEINTHYKNMTLYFFNIFSGLTNTPKDLLNISVYDIPAILEPVQDFKKVPYANMFDGTAYFHVLRTEPDYSFVETVRFSKADAYVQANQTTPILYSMKNYFGELLGPHLKAVMEVMFHGMLKPRGIYSERYQDPKLQDLYSNMGEFLQYELDDNIDNYAPLWKDYKAHNKTPYYYPYEDNFLFERGEIYKQSQSFAGDTEREDQIIKELRKKYQLQQMMLLCHISYQGESSCQDKFQPVLTDLGICYSFNARNFNESFQENTYTNIFQEVFQPEYVHLTMNQQSYKMSLILDAHKKQFDHDSSPSKQLFKLAINQDTDFFNIRDQFISLAPGKKF